MRTILAINAGSSSIKAQLVAPVDASRPLRAALTAIGGDAAELAITDARGRSERVAVTPPDHGEAAGILVEALERHGLRSRDDAPVAAGHRIVHGGPRLGAAATLDDEVAAELAALGELAPLHNAAGLSAARVLRAHLPGLPQVAVFDSAFHHALPDHARHYALPLALQREHGIRRYGFHGLSHRSAAAAAAASLARPLAGLRLVTLHLGHGASACAIRDGRSVDTSMGFTPLEGLIMGTRCGDIDPALPAFLARRTGCAIEEVEALLNHRSGLMGLCGDADMRAVERRAAAGDSDCRLAFELFCYRVRKYLGAYFAVLNGIDAVVFTGGVGEGSAAVRAAICADLDALGIAIDPRRNAAATGGSGGDITPIDRGDTATRVLVVPADEELEIARATQTWLTENRHDRQRN